MAVAGQKGWVIMMTRAPLVLGLCLAAPAAAPATGEAVGVTFLYGGLGAAIGTGIDALIARRQVVFERRSTSGVSVQIAPMVTPTRAAARFRIEF